MKTLSLTTEEFASRRRKIQDEYTDRLRPLVTEAIRNRDWSEVYVILGDLYREVYASETDDPIKPDGIPGFIDDLNDTLRNSETDWNVEATSLMIALSVINQATVDAVEGDPSVVLEWVTMHDSHVRAAHKDTEGQQRPAGEWFDVDGTKMPYPGWSGAPIDLWINCRCVLRPASMETSAASVWQSKPEDSFNLGDQMDNEEIVEEPVSVQNAGQIPWHGVLAPEGVTSGDGRMFSEGSLRNRDLPLPLTWQKVSADGHNQNVTVAKIEKLQKIGTEVHASGHFLSIPEADEVVGLIAEFGRYGVSIDADEAVAEYGDDEVLTFSDARISAACIVSIPAFAEAYVSLGYHPVLDAEMMESVEPVVGEDLAEANLVNASGGGVAGMTDQSPDLTRCVVVIDHEGRPFSSGVRVASSALPDLTAQGASASLFAGHGIPVVRSNAVFSGEGTTATLFPSSVSNLNAGSAGFRPSDVAEATVGSSALSAPVKVSVRPLLAADSASYWTLVVDGNTGNAHAAYLTPFRDYTQAERDKMMEKGEAMRPDGSFPIANCEDLKNAIQAIGRAKDPEATKAHIKKRAGALECPDVELPDTWALVASVEDFSDIEQFIDVAPGKTEDGPGWLTHPVDTDRLRDYWVRGPGAAKIGWGSPGDFNRCKVNVAEYVKPQYLNGYCANRHFDALGIWPGEHMAVEREGDTAPAISLAASGGWCAPSEWFEDPKLKKPTALSFSTDDRGTRIWGHLAEWGACHLGLSGACIEAPISPSNYAYFLLGQVETDSGPVRVGNFVIGTGHAALRLGARPAAAHYDNTGTVWADVNVGEDEHGIWFAGWVRPNVSEETLYAAKASGKLSGDWREVARGSGELELVAALSVNLEGFLTPRPSVGILAGGQTALVAAGIVEPETKVKMGLSDEDKASIAKQVAAEMFARTKREQKLAALREKVGG